MPYSTSPIRAPGPRESSAKRIFSLSEQAEEVRARPPPPCRESALLTRLIALANHHLPHGATAARCQPFTQSHIARPTPYWIRTAARGGRRPGDCTRNCVAAVTVSPSVGNAASVLPAPSRQPPAARRQRAPQNRCSRQVARGGGRRKKKGRRVREGRRCAVAAVARPSDDGSREGSQARFGFPVGSLAFQA